MTQHKISRFYIFAALISASVFHSCANEDLINALDTDDGSSFWRPVVDVKRGDGKSTVFLTNPLSFTDYVPPGPSNPQYLKIWVSDSPDQNFSLYEKVEITRTSVDVGGLENGKPYYFFVTAHKGDRADTTATLMVIPSENPDQEVLNFRTTTPISNVSISSDFNYVSFASNHNLYYKDMEAWSATLVEGSAHSANWSPVKNEFAYLTTTTEGIYVHSSELKLMDAESGVARTLFNVSYNEYSVQSPSFTRDGEMIAFLSSEGNSEKFIYDFWTIDLSSGVRKKITDFESKGFYAYGGYSWSESGDEIYLEGTFDLKSHTGIYKVALASGDIEPVIATHWREGSPSISPGGKRMAFISDRTGRNEVWVYDLVNSGYTQITGSAPNFDSRYSNLHWLSDNDILVSLTDSEKLKPVAVHVR